LWLRKQQKTLTTWQKHYYKPKNKRRRKKGASMHKKSHSAWPWTANTHKHTQTDRQGKSNQRNKQTESKKTSTK
jgi:hypothetical protein